MPVGGSGISGSVTVTISGGTAQYVVDIAGLRPGSAHAIHDHLGTCAAASRTTHLVVLAVATADMSGHIRIQVQLPAFDAGANRIVLVYASAAAAVVQGCADL